MKTQMTQKKSQTQTQTQTQTTLTQKTLTQSLTLTQMTLTQIPILTLRTLTLKNLTQNLNLIETEFSLLKKTSSPTTTKTLNLKSKNFIRKKSADS